MQRRDFLEWTIHGLGAVFAAVLGVPAVAYLIDARNRPARETGFRSVAKLGELQEEVPKEIVIRETRRDAWNLHPDDIVGRVWLVRRPGNKVDAFTTICPHLGCSINWTGEGFLCPCHSGSFDINGTRILERRGQAVGNPAPRDMDKLPVNIQPPPATAAHPDECEVQVEYKRFKTSKKEQEEDK
jgi:Rieske Fe-S protein